MKNERRYIKPETEPDWFLLDNNLLEGTNTEFIEGGDNPDLTW